MITTLGFIPWAMVSRLFFFILGLLLAQYYYIVLIKTPKGVKAYDLIPFAFWVRNFFNKIDGATVLLLVSPFIFSSCILDTVKPTEQGILVHMTKANEDGSPIVKTASGRDPYNHNSWKWNLYEYEGQYQKIDIELDGTTKDGSNVSMQLYVMYRVRGGYATEFFRRYNLKPTQVEDRLVEPSIHQTGSSVINRMTADEIYSNRDDFHEKFRKDLKRFGDSSFIEFDLKQCGIRGSVRLPAALQSLKEQQVQNDNQIAQLKIERETAQTEMLVRIAKAKADSAETTINALAIANANRIVSESINRNLIKWESLQNQKLYYKQWNGQLPKTQLGNVTPLMKLEE